VEEGEAAETLVQCKRSKTLVGERRTGADPVPRLARRLTETLRRQANCNARNAAVTDKQIGADADDRDRDFRIEPRQEQRQIVGIGRLEQKLRRSANAEPRERRQRRVLREAAANSREIAERRGTQDEPSFGGCAASMESTARSSGSRSSR
jgi:hypothetical protein